MHSNRNSNEETEKYRNTRIRNKDAHALGNRKRVARQVNAQRESRGSVKRKTVGVDRVANFDIDERRLERNTVRAGRRKHREWCQQGGEGGGGGGGMATNAAKRRQFGCVARWYQRTGN